MKYLRAVSSRMLLGGEPIQHNPHFPINTLQLMRGAVGMQLRSDAEFHRYLAAIFSAMFEHPRNLGDLQELAAVLEAAGISPALMLELVQDDRVKQALRKTTDEAVARGVFGAPTFFVGSKMFWGQDRLHFVEAALV
ncbi:hypothetical protein GJQ57_01110 [Ralstonia pickettii]|uniref:DSBA-like thioredoxin domain-containing protein n=2 Tax=Ralstonia pickettii TaxID=329 RepID=A0A7X2HIQ5_RALPI|nr:hypothetical protein [Ralstonia pickettii]